MAIMAPAARLPPLLVCTLALNTQNSWPRAARRHLVWGRVVIVVLAAVGLLPLIMETKALDATTVSGLVVMGLAPPVVLLLFTHGYRPLTFHLPFWWCARRPPRPSHVPAHESARVG